MAIIHSNSAVLQLCKFLSGEKHGSKFTYTTLSEIAGADIHRYGYLILSASKKLMSEHHRVLRSIRNYGYEIVIPEEVSTVSESYRKAAKNKYKKAALAINTVDIAVLDPVSQARHVKEQAKVAVCVAVTNAVENKLLKDATVKAPSEASILALMCKE